MRYYPIHIVVKDFFFLVTLYLSDNLIRNTYPTGWWNTKEILGASLYIGLSLLVLNLIIFTIIHFIILRFKPINSFFFGAALHLFTILIAFLNLELPLTSFLIASFISLVISGYTYKKLNSGSSFEKSIRKFAGIE